MNSARLCSLAGRYKNPIPPRCLAPIDFLKIPAWAERIGPLSSTSVTKMFKMLPLGSKLFQGIATMTYTRSHTRPSQKDLGCVVYPLNNKSLIVRSSTVCTVLLDSDLNFV
jgi:hypothetical protein